jgi:hypothetical protein
MGVPMLYEYHHIGVGFCVARSTKPGNAKASECGTSNSTNPALFVFIKYYQTETWGVNRSLNHNTIMWLWIIIIAAIIGALFSGCSSDSDNAGEDAARGALAGGCLAAGCLLRLAITAICILAILWLFFAIF